MVGVWVWVWEGLGAHGLDHGLTNLGLGLGEWWGSGGGGLGGSGYSRRHHDGLGRTP